jgi:hypothetical protein
MRGKESVSLATKWLSNRCYLNEVSVEGKTTGRFYKLLGYFDSYLAQIIRIGNCLTYLSTPLNITVNNFWNTHYLEDYARFAFLTFNRSFLDELVEKISYLKSREIARAIELLSKHHVYTGAW